MMKAAAFILAVVLVLAPAPAIGEPGRSIEWLCETFRGLSRCRVAPPPDAPPERPQSKPIEAEPAPIFVPHVPPVLTPAPAWPDPPQAVPELPKVQPKLDPPKQSDRSKTFRKEVPQRPRSTLEQQRQQELETGFCFFPISCATVCEYAKAGDTRRGTPCQNARGLACVRSTCPEVLKKKK